MRTKEEERHSPKIQLPRFTASFNDITIYNTRSTHEDTVWVAISVRVDGQAAIKAGPTLLGDYNSGPVRCQLGTDTFSVPNDATPVYFSWVAYNLGHNESAELVADVAEQIVSAAADDVLPGLGEIIDIAYRVFGQTLLDCDGPCLLVGGVKSYKGQELFQNCGISGVPFPRPSYFSFHARDSDDNNRYNSPCRTSDYAFTGMISSTGVFPPHPHPPNPHPPAKAV